MPTLVDVTCWENQVCFWTSNSTILKFAFKCHTDNKVQSYWLSKETVVNAKHSNLAEKVNKYKYTNVNASAFHNWT